jgi:hypothetical protein
VRYDLRYLGRSAVVASAAGLAMQLRPNLGRARVFYDGEVADPVRFREAISALHDVVVGDLRFRPRDKTAYQAWKQRQAGQERAIHRAVADEATRREVARRGAEAPPPGLEADFRQQHGLYWRARRQWAVELQRQDPELFRHLVPCDPVVTVAPDAVLFEGFAKDESSYGCLSVDREGFRGEGASGLGTTNVDYSLALYEHFQTLRSYRPTRLLVDPAGFEVKVAGLPEYREEQIELPASWLRGFGQLSAAVALPARRVVLRPEAVYSVLAWLRRHRERQGPRSIRFRLSPGRAPVLVLDPWGVEIASHGPAYDGPREEEVKVWGRRRLFALARLLPIAERIEVGLLGSGLPHVWVAHLGGMRFTLALSGWTANDWTGGANLDLLAGAWRDDPATTSALARYLEQARSATLPVLAAAVPAPREALLGGLNRLARQGQAMFDFGAGAYRWRPILPVALSEAVLGPESPELAAGRALHAGGRLVLDRREPLGAGKTLLAGHVEKTACEALLDADGAFSRARCGCSHFYRFRLRNGPCRHLLALQLAARAAAAPEGPPPLPPRAPAEAGRRPVELAFRREVLDLLSAEAERRGLSLGGLVEALWGRCAASVRAASSLAALGDLPGVRAARALEAPGAGAVTRAVTLAAEVHDAIEAEARRLGTTGAVLVQIAWATGLAP